MSEAANNTTSKKRKKSLIELLPEIVRKGKQKAEQVIARAQASQSRLALQTREIVDPNPATAEPEFALRRGGGAEEMNRLIYGDNLLAMGALLSQGYGGKIDLIYIDPPFDSKADYRTKVRLPEGDLSQTPAIIEQEAYGDTWHQGTNLATAFFTPVVRMNGGQRIH